MTTNEPPPPAPDQPDPAADDRPGPEARASSGSTAPGQTEGAAPTGSPPPGYGAPPLEYDPTYAQAGRSQGSQLRRSSSDRMLTGVCGGLGRHTGIDPILFRIGFVALVFAAGTGILLYIALAVLMPRDDGQPIWSRSAGRARGAGDGGPSIGGNDIGYGPPPAPSGPRSPVPGVTVAILLIGLGIVALGHRYGGWSLHPSTYFAVAVAVIGIALLVSAFGPWRRSKAGLITLGLILSLGLFVTSAVDSRGGFDEATFGERTYRPVSTDQVRDTYQVLMGQGTLDLTGLALTGGVPPEIQVNVTMGNFTILVPRDVDIQLNGDAVFGSVSAFGEPEAIDGYYGGVGTSSDVGDGEPEIIIDLDVRFGNARVTRVG